MIHKRKHLGELMRYIVEIQQVDDRHMPHEGVSPDSAKFFEKEIVYCWYQFNAEEVTRRIEILERELGNK